MGLGRRVGGDVGFHCREVGGETLEICGPGAGGEARQERAVRAVDMGRERVDEREKDRDEAV